MGNNQTQPAVRDEEIWRQVFKRLVLFAARRSSLPPLDAEEIVYEAIRLFLRRGGALDLTNPQALTRVIGSDINGLIVNMRRKKAARAVMLTADGEEAEPDEPVDSEERLIGANFARKAVTMLLKEIEADKLATDIVFRLMEGDETPAEQAKALGCSVQGVYNARRRLKAHADTIMKRMEGK